MKRTFSRTDAIWALLSFTVLIDFFNGLLPSTSIGLVCRGLLLGLCLTSLLSHNKRAAVVALVSLGLLCANAAMSFLHHRSMTGLVYDVKMLLKVGMYLIICMTLTTLYDNGKLSAKQFRWILILNICYAPGLYLLTKLLGIGAVSYVHHNVGFRSVFLSLNSINVAYIVMYTYCVERVFRMDKKDILKWIAALVYVMMPMLMLGTKTSFGVIAVVFVWYAVTRVFSKKGRKMVLPLLGGLLVIAVLGFPIIADTVLPTLARQVELLGDRDLITYLLSGRNWMLDTAKEFMAQNQTPFTTLFGHGYYASHSQLAQMSEYTKNVVRPVELDWMDLFLAYGPMSLVITYGHAGWGLLRNLKYLRTPEVEHYLISGALLLGFSAMAGHVFTEAISATFLALAVSGVHIFAQEAKKKRDMEQQEKLPEEKS